MDHNNKRKQQKKSQPFYSNSLLKCKQIDILTQIIILGSSIPIKLTITEKQWTRAHCGW